MHAQTSGLVDVHHHARPVGYIDALAKIGITAVGGRVIPQWERNRALELMDSNGIATVMLSSPDTEHAFRHADLAVGLSRRINELYAELMARDRVRFGGFASLPLPHVDAALSELEYALDVLRLDGVLLSSNHAGIYPGDPRFDPVLAELDRRDAVVFVHPASPANAQAIQLDLPGFLVEFVADTTRCIANMIAKDVPTRFPHIKFIFSHAGGIAPYFAFRLGAFGVMRHPAGQKNFVEEAPKAYAALRSFYYDTALSAHPATLRLLAEIAGADHVLFGSDHPQVPEDIFSATAKAVADFAASEPGCRGYANENACRLFPRLLQGEKSVSEFESGQMQTP